MSSTLGLADKVEGIHATFDRARIPHAFGGAIALAYYATPRATIDVDVNVFVSIDRYLEIADLLGKLGVDGFPRETMSFRDGQVRAWWGPNPIDVFFSYDPIHDAMKADVRNVPFRDATIPILAPEHLLVVKAVFDRRKDWIDIEQMLTAVGDLDVEEINRWLTHLVGKDDPRAKRVRDLIEHLIAP